MLAVTIPAILAAFVGTCVVGAIGFELISTKDQRKRNRQIKKNSKKNYENAQKKLREWNDNVEKELVNAQKIDVKKDTIMYKANNTPYPNFFITNEYPFDPKKDKMIRGYLTVLDGDKEEKHEIYVFQPRVSIGGTKIGPFVGNENGKINSQSNSQLYKAKIGNEVVHTYFPKREVLSGFDVDYYKGRAKDPYFEKLYRYELETDKNGNYVTVDMNDPEQKAKFEQYVQANDVRNKFKSPFLSLPRIFDRIKELYLIDYDKRMTEEEKQRVVDMSLYNSTVNTPQNVVSSRQASPQTMENLPYYARYNNLMQRFMPGTPAGESMHMHGGPMGGHGPGPMGGHGMH